MDERVKKILKPITDSGQLLVVQFHCEDEVKEFRFKLSEEYKTLSTSETHTLENLIVNGLAFEHAIKNINYYSYEIVREQPKSLF